MKCVTKKGLPWGLRRQRNCLQCRRSMFNPWVGKIPWRREWHSNIPAWRIPWNRGNWKTTVHGAVESPHKWANNTHVTNILERECLLQIVDTNYATQSQKWQNDLCSFLRQIIQYHSNQSHCLTNNAEEAEVDWFYEDLQDLLELTSKKDVLFIIGDWNKKEEVKRYQE